MAWGPYGGERGAGSLVAGRERAHAPPAHGRGAAGRAVARGAGDPDRGDAAARTARRLADPRRARRAALRRALPRLPVHRARGVRARARERPLRAHLDARPRLPQAGRLRRLRRVGRARHSPRRLRPRRARARRRALGDPLRGPRAAGRPPRADAAEGGLGGARAVRAPGRRRAAGTRRPARGILDWPRMQDDAVRAGMDDPLRIDAARRLLAQAPGEAIDRLTALSARLLGAAHAQVSVFTYEQVVLTPAAARRPPADA